MSVADHAIVDEDAITVWEDLDICNRSVADIQNLENMLYSDTRDNIGEMATITCQFTANDFDENLESLKTTYTYILTYFSGADDFMNVNTIHLNWLGVQGAEIGSVFFIRDEERAFWHPDPICWSNAEYQDAFEAIG